MTEILNTQCGRAEAAAALSIPAAQGAFAAAGKAQTASVRLLHSAARLPDGGFIGWQIDTASLSSRVFSSPGAGVTADDCNWIFNGCATVASGAAESLPDLRDGNRKVYALTSPRRAAVDVRDVKRGSGFALSDYDEDDLPSAAELEDALGMLKETGAVVRVCAGTKEPGMRGRGGILISLPAEMPVRMRGMLSMIIRGADVEEISGMDEKAARTADLPDELLAESVKTLLALLMCAPPAPEATDADDYAFAAADGGGAGTEGSGDCSPSADAKEAPVLIEDLDLSVRAYNCLKRAGIIGVEQLLELSDAELMRIRNLGARAVGEIRRKLAEYGLVRKAAPPEDTDFMAALDEMTGLEGVKAQIKKIAAFAKMKKELSESGGSVSVALNMEFVGNPGTAKSTVARLVAGILHGVGLLASGEMIEASRADLVAQYVGQTAVKVKELFIRAKGKLLFIDEAYSLVDDRENEFGDEAITAIVREMENRRDETVVIFAGYPDKMKDFFARNPGLRSRVPFSICFDDYSADEMTAIVGLEAKKRGFTVSPGAGAKVKDICSVAAGDPEAGNGRFCRNLVENAILGYAARVFRPDGKNADGGRELIAEDFAAPAKTETAAKPRVGFLA